MAKDRIPDPDCTRDLRPPVEPVPQVEATAVFSPAVGPAGLNEGAAPRLRGYILRGEIARGGMGRIHAALDVTLEREVAIKTLLPGADVHRFVLESKITARLPHPAIPPVHALGMLEDGTPYLVMKLVHGRTLADLLTERASPQDDLSRFVGIFEQVAQAVGFAHSQGILHRDIKPANVMVGAFGEVQVMDWGLARDLAASAQESANPDGGFGEAVGDTNHTQAGTILGTPSYMAPEQARGQIVDTRADVFSLGATLATILTGAPAFVENTVHGTIERAARADLSDVIGRLTSCGADAELVAIALRCLAANPEERPGDAREVADSVAAYRAGVDDRLRRAETEKAEALVREAEQRKRRWVWLGLAATLLLGLFASAVLAYWANTARQAAESAERVAEEKRREAEDRRREAEKQTALANAVKEYLQRDVLLMADPNTQQKEQARGARYDAEVKLRDVVVRSAEQITGKFDEQPEVELELRMTLGVTLLHMGRADLAVVQYERVRDLCGQLYGPEHPRTLRGLSNLAGSYFRRGRHREALELYEEILTQRKKRFAPEHPELLHAMQQLASGYQAVGRWTDAISLHEETLRLYRATSGRENRQTLHVMTNLANSYESAGRNAEALQLREETLLLQQRTLGPDHPDTISSMNNLAASYRTDRRHPEALKLLEEAFRLSRDKLGPEHIDTLVIRTSLASAYEAVNRRGDALHLREETLEICKRVLGPEHPDTLRNMHNLAVSYDSQGRRNDAMKLREETVKVRKGVLGVDHPDTLETQHNLGNSYAALGRHADALKIRQETFEAASRRLGNDHPLTLLVGWSVVASLMAMDRRDDALPLIDDLLQQADRAQAAGKAADPRMVPALFNSRIRIYAGREDPVGCRATVEMWEKRNLTEAEDLFRAARWRGLTGAVQINHGGEGAEQRATGDVERALEWLKKAVQAGLKDRQRIEKEVDLEILRERQEFRKVLDSLPNPGK